jgi:hypothetical protein
MASILDDLQARRTVGSRPADLADDLDWILAPSGRAETTDNRRRGSANRLSVLHGSGASAVLMPCLR